MASVLIILTLYFAHGKLGVNNVEGIIKKMLPSIVEDSTRWSKYCKKWRS